jgi:mono/diheme cytochrome c family protein
MVKPTRFLLAGMLLLVVSGAILEGQGEAVAQDDQVKGIKKVPITYSDPSSGKQMFRDYCAACHGMEGKGDGPVARFLRTPPADLGALARHNGGKYPADKVTATLRLGTDSGAHGTSDMPTWGPLFRGQDKKAGLGFAEVRLHNLTEYVKSLQQK